MVFHGNDSLINLTADFAVAQEGMFLHQGRGRDGEVGRASAHLANNPLPLSPGYVV